VGGAVGLLVVAICSFAVVVVYTSVVLKSIVAEVVEVEVEIVSFVPSMAVSVVLISIAAVVEIDSPSHSSSPPTTRSVLFTAR